MREILSRLSVVKELLLFFWQNKLWWMIPFVLVLLLISVLLISSQSVPILPLIYSAF